MGHFFSGEFGGGGARKQQTAAPNGFSLFVRRLRLLPLSEHVVYGGVQRRVSGENK